MNQRPKRRFLGLIGGCALVGFLVLIATASTNAQSNGGGGIPAVLAALAHLQNTVEQLLPGAPKTVRFTPAAVAHTGDVVNCRVVNVTDAVLTVSTDVRGQFLSNNVPFSIPLGQTQVAAGGVHDGFVVAGTNLNAYCRFTVVNGTADDIRASLAIHDNQGAENISLPAE